MPKTPTVQAVDSPGTDLSGSDIDLVDYCSRPLCRTEFRQSAGRGRRKDYCSETCRRLADRDYKRAKAMVEHFQRLAERSRHDLKAFGRAADEFDSREDLGDEVARERAFGAVGRARAVLQFVGDADSRLVAELTALCDGVAPLLTQSATG